MKNFNELLDKLTNEGKEISDITDMVANFKAAETDDEMEYYMNQLYGVLIGFAVLGYITFDEVNAIQNGIEEDGIQ